MTSNWSAPTVPMILRPLSEDSYGLALAQENFKDIRFHFTSEF